jgi:RNA polymerase sigma-70 factor (ECF subfamily)
MIDIWRNRQKLFEITNIRVFAFVMARNLSLNMLKKQMKKETIFLDDLEVELVLNTPGPEQILINEEVKYKLETAVKSLPTKCKLVFKLIKEEALTYKETAEILELSVKTVDGHFTTAIKKLTSSLKVEFNLA